MLSLNKNSGYNQTGPRYRATDMTKLLRKWLILCHRYAGIVLSLFVVMWLMTGIAMMYVGGMPRVTPETRLEKLPSLDLARVRLRRRKPPKPG